MCTMGAGGFGGSRHIRGHDGAVMGVRSGKTPAALVVGAAAGRAARGGGSALPAGGRLPRLLLVVGFGLLIAAWVGGNAPGFGPDEPAHFVKEVGAGSGQWLGTPGRLSNPTFGGGRPGREERIAWINQNSRVFRLPVGLDPGAAIHSGTRRAGGPLGSRSRRPARPACSPSPWPVWPPARRRRRRPRRVPPDSKTSSSRPGHRAGRQHRRDGVPHPSPRPAGRPLDRTTPVTASVTYP
jgi:hypothetical protein